MVAAFLEVHHDVEQRNGLGASLVQFVKVTSQNPSIVFPGRVCVCVLDCMVYCMVQCTCTCIFAHVLMGYQSRDTHFCIGLSSTRTISSLFGGMS